MLRSGLAVLPLALLSLGCQADNHATDHATDHASASLTVEMTNVQTGQSAGSVKLHDHEHGLVLTPDLQGLDTGGHGFHVHENPSCDTAMKDGEKVPGGAAGSHYDPHNTDNHGVPWSKDSHLGDLPLLYVGEEGQATHPVIATRLSVADVKGRALMVHADGDNYADEPEKLGGGGARVACGVIR